jgi:hypothetical protein
MSDQKTFVPGAAALPLLEMLPELGGARELILFVDGKIPMLAQSAPMEPAVVRFKLGDTVFLFRRYRFLIAFDLTVLKARHGGAVEKVAEALFTVTVVAEA